MFRIEFEQVSKDVQQTGIKEFFKSHKLPYQFIWIETHEEVPFTRKNLKIFFRGEVEAQYVCSKLDVMQLELENVLGKYLLRSSPCAATDKELMDIECPAWVHNGSHFVERWLVYDNLVIANERLSHQRDAAIDEAKKLKIDIDRLQKANDYVKLGIDFVLTVNTTKPTLQILPMRRTNLSRRIR